MNKTKRLSDYRYLIPLYGDIPLFFGIFKGELWTRQYQIWIKGDGPAILSGLRALLGFFITVFAFPVRAFLRYRHGIHTIGWFLAAYTALTIIFFNWAGREYRWTPLYTIWYPIRETYNGVFHPDRPSWWPDMITNFYSLHLLWFCLTFCALAAIHILVSYFTVKGDERDIKRGIPVLWALATLLSKNFQGKDRLPIWWILEAIIIGGIGAYLFYGFHDRTLGIFLIYSASCHFALESYESIGLARFITR